jgi:hypothetical protein
VTAQASSQTSQAGSLVVGLRGGQGSLSDSVTLSITPTPCLPLRLALIIHDGEPGRRELHRGTDTAGLVALVHFRLRSMATDSCICRRVPETNPASGTSDASKRAREVVAGWIEGELQRPITAHCLFVRLTRRKSLSTLGDDRRRS